MSGRITPEQARKILGMISKNYSDEDIVEILRCLYDIAELGHEAYRSRDEQT